GRPALAIAAVKAPVVRIRIALGTGSDASFTGHGVGDAVRPGVISAESDTTRGAALNRQQQAVITGRAARAYFLYRSVELSARRIRQTQHAALVGVGRRRACGVCHTVDRARCQS